MKSIFRAALLLSTCAVIKSEIANAQPPLSECDAAYTISINQASYELDACYLEVDSNYRLCTGFPYNLYPSLSHRQMCNRDKAEGVESCLGVFDSRVEAAERARRACSDLASNNEPNVVVIYDPWDNQGLLGELNIADGDEFNCAANQICATYPHSVLVSTTSNEENRVNVNSIVDAGRELTGPVDHVYVIDHGGDSNGDGLIDQTIGSNQNILTGELLDNFCRAIDDITDPGGRIYLCGCNVGSNSDLCHYISQNTGCSVYASTGPVVYSEENGHIDLSSLHIVCPYMPGAE